MTSKLIFATAQDVENAFYDALERGDLEAMMAVWAEDEEIVCVHPGGPMLVGYATIRDAWRRIFDHGRRLDVQRSPPTVIATPFVATHCLIERIRVSPSPANSEQTQAPVAATNVYLRGPLGWRMTVHHSSPVPPESLTEAPKVLH